jgi:heptose I phosphotransferase
VTLYMREDIASLWQGTDAFVSAQALQGDVYRQVKGRRTLRFEAAGRSYFAKIHHGVGWLEIIKNLLTLKKPVVSARQEWQAITRLHSLGIATMSLAAYGERGRNPATRFSFLLTDELAQTTSLETLCAQWRTQRPAFSFKCRLIAEVARISRVLHGNGVCHRDYYLCHFLLDNSTADAGQPALSVIDLHRALLGDKLHPRWVEKDIAALYFSCDNIGLSRTDLCRFVCAYTGMGLREALQDRSAFWQAVQDRAGKIRRREVRKQERSKRKQSHAENGVSA